MFSRNKYSRGMAPLLTVLIVLLAATFGTTAGVKYKNDINKVLVGQSNQQALDSEESEGTDNGQALGKSKFELNGTVTAIDAAESTITVKIKSSTNSVKTLKDSETAIKLAADARVVYKGKTDPTLADIPIGAKVQIGGTISDSILTGTKVEVQKEEAKTVLNQTKFELNGTVAAVGTGELTVAIKSANKLISSIKGSTVTIKTAANTIIEEGDGQITLADIGVGDKVHVSGIYKDSVLTAARIVVAFEEVEVTEQETEGAQSVTSSTDANSSSSSGNSSNAPGRSND
ncbi:MAG: hypothetical protein Q7S37_02145 [bacterium]|nr:hypothetical protein [bacterium]